MVSYYDPRAGVLPSMFKPVGTVIAICMRRKEYWAYVLVHTVIVLAAKNNLFQEFNIFIEVDDYEWEAAFVIQYFLTFFTVFYNHLCYSRYIDKLYPACCDMIDTVEAIVTEMNVSLYHPELTRHRTMISKYFLAVVYEMFMTVTGGKLGKPNWHEMHQKGLLAEGEVKLLSKFPGHKCTSLLQCWAMLIVQNACRQDCLWHPIKAGSKLMATGSVPILSVIDDPKKGTQRNHDNAEPVHHLNRGDFVVAEGPPDAAGRIVIISPKRGIIDLHNMTGWRAPGAESVHIYDRFNELSSHLLTTTHYIGTQVAMPVPFTFYHLNSVALMLNLLTLGFFPAFHNNYGTVAIFMLETLIFLAVKMVSAAMNDPFSVDGMELPVPEFINHTFDRAITLLFAFSQDEARYDLVCRIEDVAEFEEKEGRGIRRHVQSTVLIEKGAKAKPGGVFSWMRPTAISKLDPDVSVESSLSGSLLIGNPLASADGMVRKYNLAVTKISRCWRGRKARCGVWDRCQEQIDTAERKSAAFKDEVMLRLQQLKILREVTVNPSADSKARTNRIQKQKLLDELESKIKFYEEKESQEHLFTEEDIAE
eukprot:TRINITY_DN42057_c0_g1_i1.p1 TRINITY_DN42057_c0_g1~~TRINITY_DN42057_c0_g1_i1.p1  ORF type:complete len:590 (-),score=118.66 TRINITY_DN42057_c0_g1_i1:66-1835(-)